MAAATPSVVLMLLIGSANSNQFKPADELYPPLFGFNPNGNPLAYTGSDPLARFTWDASVNVTGLQRYEAYATAALVSPASAASSAGSLVNGGGNATFLKFGHLRLDFGVERAGWFEFFSPDLGSVLASGQVVVKASISEYDEPWTGKTQPVKAYDGGLFRLETNAELYEGVRFAWIFYEGSVEAAPPWTITKAHVVAQVKPVNYTSSFNSSDSTLTAVWHAGALGSRLNMHDQYFGSILMERGDRVSIQGDGHPTMAAALAAFASPELHRLVHVMLNATDSGCKGCSVVDAYIMSYPVLWTMSVHDWLWSSGEVATFLSDFANDVATILDNANRTFLTNPSLSLMGWDDRLGNGWCFPPLTPCGREPQLTFAALLTFAVQEFSAALTYARDVRATKYSAMASDMVARLRHAVDFDNGTLGVHSASMLLNVAGLASRSEAATLISAYLNDSTSICSWSPFNSYWILQGLGNAGALDRAAEMAALCWGGMTRMAPGCFWELFSPMWESLVAPGGKAPTRPSYCHPWSNGVTAWLSHAIGGVNPASPGDGGRGYVATPHVSVARPETVVTTATPAGATIAIHATHSQSANGRAIRTVQVHAPATPGVVGMPARDADELPGCKLQQLLVDGVEVRPAALESEELGGALRFQGSLRLTHLFTPLLPPGDHSVAGHYECAQVAGSGPVFPPVAWRALAWDLDVSTLGAWQGRKGSDGYFLFSFDTNATGAPVDVVALPAYGVSVRAHEAGFDHTDYTCLGANETDPAFLQDPRAGGAVRRLGFATAGGDGSQGIAIDVNMTANSPTPTKRRISFYLSSTQQPTSAVDPYQTGSPSMVVRVMDLIDLNPIAPEVRIGDYERGVYYSVTICCSCPVAGRSSTPAWCGVRARFSQIDGTNTVSAVMFDTVA